MTSMTTDPKTNTEFDTTNARARAEEVVTLNLIPLKGDRRERLIGDIVWEQRNAWTQGFQAGIAAAIQTMKPAAEPEPTVQCPACRQQVTPLGDGTLPGHDIAPGPRRSPRCRFRGSVRPCLNTGHESYDLIAEDLAHEIPADAEQFVLAVQQPGGGAS